MKEEKNKMSFKRNESESAEVLLHKELEGSDHAGSGQQFIGFWTCLGVDEAGLIWCISM